nr:hypothetical protein [Tanacetum cinerariifolium]
SSFNQRECLGCGQPCDGFHYSCTCHQSGVILLNGMCINCTYGYEKPITCCVCKGTLRDGFCLFCDSNAENSFTYDPNAYSFNNTSSNFNHLSQPQYETYLCKLCGNDLHYGYDCQPQFPFVYKQESSYNQNYNDNYYPHDSSSFICSDNCEGSHETFQSQPKDQNIDSSGFDQIQTPQYPVIDQPSQEMSEEVSKAKRNLMKSIQTFLEKFNRIPFGGMPKILLQAWENFFSIQHAQPEDSNELFQKLLEDLQIINKELAEYINSPSWNRPTFYNDGEEHSVQYKEYLANTSNSDIHQLIREEFTPILPTEEPGYSLSMGYEYLSTIPEKESDKVTKSSVKNLLPIPSDDDESIFDEDVPIEDFKVYSNPLFDTDEIYSHYFNAKYDLIEALSNRDTLFNSPLKFYYLEEFSGELMHSSIIDKERIRREHEEYTSLMEKLLAINSCIESDDYDSKKDIHFIEELLVNDSISLPENELFYFDHHDNLAFPRPPSEPPDVESFFDLEPNSGEVISAVINNIDELNEDECFDLR